MTAGRHGRDEFRFDARYGRLMRKSGIGTLPFAVLFYQRELGITPPEIWLIVYVLAHRWTSDIPYPAIREIERRSGVSKKTVFKYKASLEDKGYLEVVHRTRPDGGNTSIGWDFSPLFEKVDELIMRDIDWWKSRNPQFIDEDSTDGGPGGGSADNPVDNRRAGDYAYPGPGGSMYPRAGVHASTRAGHHQYTEAVDPATPHEEDTGEDLAEGQKYQSVKPWERQVRATSSNSSGNNSMVPLDDSAEADRPSLPSSPLIDRIVEDYAARLHDEGKNVRSDCTRARRLWATSKLREDDFVGLLHEAYRRTQQSSQRIRKSAKAGPYGTKNKMPYFFSVLTQLTDEAKDNAE